jgi:alkyl sulfatase BDS1-like metallo-beta-lactamase superfamily hydrolase
MTVIEGDTGWIIVDPLTSKEAASAAMELVTKHLGHRSVKAVIYTHAHADHFGGVKGVISEEDVQAGLVDILAPHGFMEHYKNDNVAAGNCMARRAQYQFGMLLPVDAKGNVDNGLGLAISAGTLSIIPPTDDICGPDASRTVDGVGIQFMDTPGAEACEEMMIYFP